ncbi:MAG: cell division protein ZapA [Paludibacteraceae bacterium]|nr:cell division protein ZapA [Paludibacteraceae bacterium]
MADNDKFEITLKLGSLVFRPTVKRSEEENYRKAAEYINSKIKMWRDKSSSFSETQNLSLVALELAVELIVLQNDQSEMVSEMQKLDELLKSGK